MEPKWLSYGLKLMKFMRKNDLNFGEDLKSLYWRWCVLISTTYRLILMILCRYRNYAKEEMIHNY